MSFYLMHRGWRDHHLFKNQPYSEAEAWEHLIASANFISGKYRQANKVYEIPRGSLATSFRSLAEKWKWSTNKVIRFLKLLQSEEMILIKTEHNFLHINVVNYETYQNPLLEKETETDTWSEQPRNTDGDRKKTETDTNVNKINNLNKENKNKEEVMPISASSALIPPPSKTDFQKLVLIWSEELPECPKVQRLTEQRKRLLANRLKDSFASDTEQWRAYCQAIRGSPFCLGENDRGWRANIDWALKPQTIAKVLEGFYLQAEKSQAPSKTDLALEEASKRYA